MRETQSKQDLSANLKCSERDRCLSFTCPWRKCVHISHGHPQSSLSLASRGQGKNLLFFNSMSVICLGNPCRLIVWPSKFDTSSEYTGKWCSLGLSAEKLFYTGVETTYAPSLPQAVMLCPLDTELLPLCLSWKQLCCKNFQYLHKFHSSSLLGTLDASLAVTQGHKTSCNHGSWA